MAAPPVVALEGVSKRFGAQAALEDLTLSVPEGQLLVLLGTSGSGKTTALRMINGLARPDAGRVRTLGEDVATTDPVALRRRIGYVIQEGGLFPHLTVIENVTVVPRLLGWAADRMEARGRELLTLVRLDPDQVAARRPSELSGGERQRVGLARALAASPPLLLMDEPFGALDPLTRRQLQFDFDELRRRLGTTVVLVTHDVAEALRLGDQVAVLHQGRLVQQGRPREIRDQARPGFVRDFVS
ncbi:MAG TPA: ATP-binding cassette domain-containing protein, partial [Vicinamibacteria bacterium]|nr:ATP-binding cassette domain-containing protein [Vicinamibacteria bacterium]